MKPFHPLDKDIALQFKDVAFSYGAFRVFESISFHIHQGEFVTLSGANGTGKTTILKLILGLEYPSGGTVTLLGNDPRYCRDHVGYVPQLARYDQAFPISVGHVVRMGRLHPVSRRFTKEDKLAVEEAMDQVEIRDLADRSYSALSGGQRRRVLVARALAIKPAIMILDEPTANMDTESEERLYKSLESLKGRTTILIVTHDTGFASSLSSRVLCLERRNGLGDCRIVQHSIENGKDGLDYPGRRDIARISHKKCIPGDACYDGADDE